jgi:membrane protease YdiL (CAAX protease family)
MSIIGDVADTATRQRAELFGLLVLVGIVLLTTGLAWWIKAFQRRSISGPSRLEDNESLGVIALILGLAVFVLLFAQILSFMATSDRLSSTKPSSTTTPIITTTTELTLTPKQMAIATTVPSLAAFAFMVAANAIWRRRGLFQLGLSSSQFFRGIGMGTIGSLIAVPWTFFAGQATPFLWRWLRFEHPKEHDLLRVLGESTSPVVRIVLILSAVLVAPFFEELIFRGHLQTLITNGISRIKQWRSRRPVSQGFEVILPGGEIGKVLLPPVRPPLLPPTAAIRWISVIVTSALFAIVHPVWMQPPIFILAICLGYAYERTGNLWTNITMHAMFNTTSTVLFLFFMH